MLNNKAKCEIVSKFYDLKTDVVSVNKVINIYAEVPGMELEDININYVGSFLIIKGLKKKYKSYREELYIDNGCPYGIFKKYIAVPNADFQNINLEIDKGILHISLKLN